MRFIITDGNHFVYFYPDFVQCFGNETGIGIGDLSDENFVANSDDGCFQLDGSIVGLFDLSIVGFLDGVKLVHLKQNSLARIVAETPQG